MNLEAESCVPDTQETYDEDANDVSKKGLVSETQNTSLNESQDFCLVDSEADESVKVEDNNCRKSVEQQILDTSQSMADDKIITKNDNEDGNVVNEKVTENENKKIKETDENVSSNVCDSEKKDELSDEDEIIQSTPPHTYSPSKKVVSNINVTNLKRKAESFDEPPAKIIKTTSMEDAMSAKKQFEEEESHQSCESDDSYQDLFKNMEKNVIIEETQDPTNQEFTQNFLKSTPERSSTTGDDKISTHHFEQTNQQQDNKNFFSQKCCDIEKDENLNVSAKLTDISANESIVANADSINESDSQMKDDLSIETRKNIISTSIDEKSETKILEETDKSEKLKDTEMMSVESDKTETVEKTTEKNDDSSSSQIKVPGENQLSNVAKKSRSSVELIYDGAMKRAVDDDKNKSKSEVMEIDVDAEKNALDSSTEVIYDRKKAKAKPEVIEIVNDSREKIVLDSFGEGLEVQTVVNKSSFESKNSSDFSYKSMESTKETSLESKLTEKKMMNGSAKSKGSNTDSTMNMESDTYSGCNMPATLARGEINIAMYNLKKLSSEKGNSFVSKDLDNIELINISDNETSINEEKDKSELIHNCALAKTVQVEREIGMYVKLKCLLHMDENTKEFISKELTAVQCEPAMSESSLMSRLKSEDSQSSLADISDNKDSSPGSVNSNPQLYPLNPSRLSTMSSISSSSSASSAASLAVKLALKSSTLFSMPVGPAKHAKKLAQDPILLTMGDKQVTDEAYDRMTREWKNHRLLTSTILNCVNAELSCGVASITTATTIDSDANLSNERLDDHHLQKNNIHSSTPEITTANLKNELHATPKSTKKSKPAKRPRSKLTKPNVAQTNGENNKSALNMNTLNLNFPSEANVSTPSRKKAKIENTGNKLLISDSDVLANSSPQEMLVDCLVGKNVFAKWSDNNYYPGKVADQLKNKYKVNFYDGKSKILIPEFVIPIPKTLREGLSVYVTTNAHDYDSSGIIVDVQTLTNSDNIDNTYYTVETDEGERLRVQMQDISLSTDQAKVLKEEMDDVNKSSLPNTPKALGQVSLDNMVDGKRRSKRIGTPIFSTPKSRINVGTSNSASKSKEEPSISGISVKLKENEDFSSDSNVESIPMLDEYILRGVQKEIIGTPYEHIVKGPLNRIKSKPRSKRKVDNEQTIATLGPIPSANSNIFKGLSFILTCASLESLDRYHDSKSQGASSTEADVTESDIETENEEDWMERPFVRDRLQAQIIAGGGKFYENFNQIPKDEYKNTKLITNVPNTTAKSILCLSVGIPPCNHKWIIRCCSEGKALSAAENALPTGWSLQKKTYVEMFQASGNKPLSEIVIIIPNLEFDSQFATFWQQVCENAGAVVLIAENSDVMETMDFDSDVVAVSNQRCPSWTVNKASQLQIPLLSTTWVIQCLIEGKLCPYDQHQRYKYNYIPN